MPPGRRTAGRSSSGGSSAPTPPRQVEDDELGPTPDVDDVRPATACRERLGVLRTASVRGPRARGRPAIVAPTSRAAQVAGDGLDLGQLRHPASGDRHGLVGLGRRSRRPRVSGVIDSQSSPTLTSTVSGTSSGRAPSMVSRTIGASRSTSSRGTSSSSSSWTWRSVRARKPSSASRSCEPDHRDLHDVRGRPLDRHVDGHPLACPAKRRVAGAQLGDLALPAEQRRDEALALGRLLDVEHVVADAGVGREVAVDELLGLLAADAGPADESPKSLIP